MGVPGSNPGGLDEFKASKLVLVERVGEVRDLSEFSVRYRRAMN
jgi:hypothetical protein